MTRPRPAHRRQAIDEEEQMMHIEPTHAAGPGHGTVAARRISGAGHG